MKATLTTLTPVHIGNGNTYNKNIDFFQRDKHIGIIDEAKVLKFIGIENIHQWTAAIEKGGEAFSELLKQRGWKGDLQSICSRIMPVNHIQQNTTQLKEQYRSALRGISIPGSSFKGAIKTAILDYITNLKNNINRISASQLYETKNDGKKIWKDKKTDSMLFGENANEKSTRFLKVEDIYFGNIVSHIYEVQILNAGLDNWGFKQGQQFLAEVIPIGSKALFNLVVDQKLLELNIIKYPEKWEKVNTEFLSKGLFYLCKIINAFTQANIEYEINIVFSNEEKLNDQGNKMIENYNTIVKQVKECKENEFIIRIGSNSGYLFTTGKWVDKINDFYDTDDYFLLRKTIQKRIYKDMEKWPKTRKITSNGEIFGFVKVTLGEFS